MFVLREILNGGEEINTILGNTYSIYRRGQDAFEKINKEQGFADSVIAIIYTDDGYHPIVSGRRAYVMQENGATFSRVDIPSREDLERTKKVWNINKEKKDW